MNRKHFLQLAAATTGAMMLPHKTFAQPTKPLPKGIGNLFPNQGSLEHPNPVIIAGDQSLTNPAVKILNLRQAWSDLQPRNGYYDFSFLTNAIQIAAQYGKQVSISLVGGVCAPSWLYPLCSDVLTLTGNDAKHGPMMPAPWDSVAKTHWHSVIIQLAAAFDSSPTVSYFTLNGFGHTEEAFLLTDPNDVGQWNESAWLGAAQDIISAASKNILQTPFFVTWGIPISPGGSTVMDDVYETNAYFGFKSDGLTSAFPNPNTPEGQCILTIMAGYPCVMQMATVNGTYDALSGALSNGASLGATAFEVYPPDTSNPDFASLLESYN